MATPKLQVPNFDAFRNMSAFGKNVSSKNPIKELSPIRNIANMSKGAIRRESKMYLSSNYIYTTFKQFSKIKTTTGIGKFHKHLIRHHIQLTETGNQNDKALEMMWMALCRTWEDNEEVNNKLDGIINLWRQHVISQRQDLILPTENYLNDLDFICEKVNRCSRKLMDYDASRHYLDDLKRSSSPSAKKIRKQLRVVKDKFKEYETLSTEIFPNLKNFYVSHTIKVLELLQQYFIQKATFHKGVGHFYKELQTTLPALENQKWSVTSDSDSSAIISYNRHWSKSSIHGKEVSKSKMFDIKGVAKHAQGIFKGMVHQEKEIQPFEGMIRVNEDEVMKEPAPQRISRHGRLLEIIGKDDISRFHKRLVRYRIQVLETYMQKQRTVDTMRKMLKPVWEETVDININYDMVIPTWRGHIDDLKSNVIIPLETYMEELQTLSRKITKCNRKLFEYQSNRQFLLDLKKSTGVDQRRIHLQIKNVREKYRDYVLYKNDLTPEIQQFYETHAARLKEILEALCYQEKEFHKKVNLLFKNLQIITPGLSEVISEEYQKMSKEIIEEVADVSEETVQGDCLKKLSSEKFKPNITCDLSPSEENSSSSV